MINYEQQFTVTQRECDMFNKMKSGAVLRRAQQISTDNCDSVELTSDVYAANNAAFLLAKSSLNLLQPIMCNDKLIIKTQAYSPVRAIYFRQTQIFKNDILVASVDSHWILIDTLTKRIMRKAPQEIAQFFSTEIICVEPIAIAKTDAQEVASITALFSMCDINGHINNTIYADIIIDFLPNINDKMQIKGLSINYRSEIVFNEQFILYRGKVDENTYYFYGASKNEQGDEKIHFEANLVIA